MLTSLLSAWLLSTGEVDSHWLGFSDQSAEGGWVWSDGSPVAFVDWADGEPNNYGNGEDCAEIVVGGLAGGGTWNDQKCDMKSKAVCEKRGDNYVYPPTPPPPTVKCEEGWTEFESRCYYFSTTNANSWNEAAQTCHNLNFLSTLTSVTSSGELEFILSKIWSSYCSVTRIFTFLQLILTSMTQYSSEELTRTLRELGAGLTTKPGSFPTFLRVNLMAGLTRIAWRW